MFLRQSGSRFLWTAAVLFCAALVPEYALPVLCFAAYIAVLRHVRLSLTAPEKTLLLFVWWTTIGIVYSHARATGLVIIGQWLLFTPLLFLTRFSVDSRQKLDALFLCGAVSGGIAGGIGIGQMVVYHVFPALGKWFNPFWHFLDMGAAKLFFRILPFAGERLPRQQFISIQTRASGTFTNPVFFACFLCMMLPLCVYCVLFLRTRFLRIVSVVCLLLCVGGIASSYSRGPYLVLIVVFAVLLLYGRRYAWKLLCAAAGILALVAVFAGGVFRRLLTIFNIHDISVNAHSSIWRAAFRMLRGHLLFGYGTGIGNVRQMLHDTYHIPQPHAHNLFLEILLENGLIGLVLFIAVLVIFLRQMLCLARRSERARAVAVTLTASVAALCACGMTDYVFYGMKPMAYLLLMIGLSQCASQIYDTPADAQPEAQEKVLETIG